MPPAHDPDRLWRRAATQLTLGPTSAPELTRLLGISQPSLSRLLSKHAGELLVTGSARATRYALRRAIPDVGTRIPVYEIDEHGAARQLALLHPAGERGFHVEPTTGDADAGFHRDLPWFLDGMRPSGFLGRLVPRQHPELALPADIRLWSGDQTLRYLCRFGWNTVGNLESFSRGRSGMAEARRRTFPSRANLSGCSRTTWRLALFHAALMSRVFDICPTRPSRCTTISFDGVVPGGSCRSTSTIPLVSFPVESPRSKPARRVSAK
jgi:hypothetical protein